MNPSYIFRARSVQPSPHTTVSLALPHLPSSSTIGKVITLAYLDSPGYTPYLKVSFLATLIPFLPCNLIDSQVLGIRTRPSFGVSLFCLPHIPPFLYSYPTSHCFVFGWESVLPGFNRKPKKCKTLPDTKSSKKFVLMEEIFTYTKTLVKAKYDQWQRAVPNNSKEHREQPINFFFI